MLDLYETCVHGATHRATNNNNERQRIESLMECSVFELDALPQHTYVLQRNQ